MPILRAAGLFLALVLLHAAGLRLPYFWDETGYFVPVARDLCNTGDPIPRSVAPTPHPPLVPAVVALAWRWFGASIIVTRLTMLWWAVAACWGAYALSARLAPAHARAAGWMSMVCLAVYPVFFAQSTLAQLDLPAAALTLWALAFYAGRRLALTAVLLSAAVVAKESAAVCAAALAALELVWPPANTVQRRGLSAAILLLPVVVLALWLAYFAARTGGFLGTTEWAAFNAGTNSLAPERIAGAALLRLWHATGHVFLFALTVPAVAVLLLVRTTIARGNKRLAVALVCCVGAYVAAFSLLGGAVLARYMLTAVALVIVLCSAVLSALPLGKWIATAVALAAFGVGLVAAPPYHCAYDDTLLYRDFVRLHVEAAGYLEASGEAVITTWPATDEFLHPENGYVKRPLRVVAVDDLTPQKLHEARTHCAACLIFVFPTQYGPPSGAWLRPGRILRGLAFWRSAQQRFETRQSLLSPAELAASLGAQVVWQRHAGSLQTAVLRAR